jgi:hypothetical protein
MSKYDDPSVAYPDPKKVKVLVSISMSKEVEVNVDDYEAEEEEDGVSYDYTYCDLYGAVKKQITLPTEKFKDWILDEMVVELEETDI